MSQITRTLFVLALLVSIPACSSTSDTTNNDANKSDVGHDTSQQDTKDNQDEADPNCHHDCWSGYHCVEGNVFQGAGSPLPCTEATKENIQLCDEGTLVGTCEKGCIEHADFTAEGPWEVLCHQDITEPDPELPTDCTVTLELSNSIITIAQTWPTPIAATPRPLICWTTPPDATLPAPENGWEVVVQREDKLSDDFEFSEWSTTLLPVQTRQIHYGDCDLQPTNCTTAKDLTPGKYFIHVLEPNNPNGLAASLVVTVE